VSERVTEKLCECFNHTLFRIVISDVRNVSKIKVERGFVFSDVGPETEDRVFRNIRKVSKETIG
jgi:hypothetical protein